MCAYYRYKVFGLKILSTLELPDLVFHPFQKEDVIIVYGKNPDNIDPIRVKGVLFQANKDSFLFKLDNIASYLVQEGKSITIEAAEGSTLKDIRLFLLGPVFGALIHQNGMVPLHASSVGKLNQVTMFCGQSGSGKSTLAALLNKKGYSLLADDISVIKTIDNISSVIPGITTIKLWEDVAEILYQDYNKYPKVRDQLLRYKIPGFSLMEDNVNQIRNIIILERKNSLGFDLRKVTGIEKFTLLKDNTYRIQFIEGLEASVNHFHEINNLLKNVNVFIVRRPSSPLLLNELVSFIEANNLI